MPKQQRHEYGSFTWVRNDDGKEESWDLVRIPDLLTTYWAVKNYGGDPGPGFTGWKLVSGGPFDEAGAWATRDEAMRGVIPYLLADLRAEVAKKLAEADAALTALTRLQIALSFWS